MSESYFSGPFASMCELFVTQKRAAGLVYTQQALVLRMFDNFCKDYTIENYTITEEIAMAWSKSRPNESEAFRYSRVGEMQRFSEFLIRQGCSSYLLAGLPLKGEIHRPYIFSDDEIQHILQRVDELEPTGLSPNRHLAIPLMLRVLYGCGMRTSEVLALTKRDVDMEKGILHVRHGKNDRERIVPMSTSLIAQCKNYIRTVHANTSDDTFFFHKKDGTSYSRWGLGKQFRGFLWDVGIAYRGTKLGPRVHDLRHTFVCHNIRRWGEQGIPIQHMLPILSKYLGHSSISATQWYLRLTSEVYPHLRDICERELSGMYADIPNIQWDGEDDE